MFLKVKTLKQLWEAADFFGGGGIYGRAIKVLK